MLLISNSIYLGPVLTWCWFVCDHLIRSLIYLGESSLSDSSKIKPNVVVTQTFPSIGRVLTLGRCRVWRYMWHDTYNPALPQSRMLTCRCDVFEWSPPRLIHCLAPQLMALHLSSTAFPCLHSSSFILSMERRWLGSFSFSLWLSTDWGFNWSKILSCSCYSPAWIGILSKSLFMSFSTAAPPEPNIFYCFVSWLPSLCSFTCHTYWNFFILIVPSFVLLNSCKFMINIFSFPLPKPVSLLKPIFSVHLCFIPPFSPLSCLPRPFHPRPHRWWVSGSLRTASALWAVPCFCALSTRLSCPPMRLASWIRSPCPG